MHVTNVKQSILNDYNRLNDIKPAVTLDDVDFTDIAIWLQGACNTRSTLVSKQTSENFVNSTIVYFVRRRIDLDLQGVKIPGKPEDYTNIYSVLKVLREKIGIPVFDEEFVNSPVTGETVTLIPFANSMAYLPTHTATLSFAGK